MQTGRSFWTNYRSFRPRTMLARRHLGLRKPTTQAGETVGPLGPEDLLHGDNRKTRKKCFTALSERVIRRFLSMTQGSPRGPGQPWAVMFISVGNCTNSKNWALVSHFVDCRPVPFRIVIAAERLLMPIPGQQSRIVVSAILHPD